MSTRLYMQVRDMPIGIDNHLASKRPAKQRATKISGLVDKVCARAYEDGLLTEELHKLLDIVTLPNELDQGSLGSLIRNLYPVSKVPDSAVVKVIGCLGNGRFKPSYTTQAGLLKWLVLVYTVLENPRILSQLYSIIFNLIDTAAIRYAPSRKLKCSANLAFQTSSMSRAFINYTAKACSAI